MSKAHQRLYKDGIRTRYGQNTNPEDLETVINTNIKVVGLLSMTGATKIWTTPSFNRARGVKNKENENQFDLQKENREVKALSDHHRGVGFWIPEYVYTNDVDLV